MRTYARTLTSLIVVLATSACLKVGEPHEGLEDTTVRNANVVLTIGITLTAIGFSVAVAQLVE